MKAILGGTFDPIHEGHLYMAKKVLDHFDLERIYFVPAKQNPHKTLVPGANPKQRLEMVRLALEEYGEEKFEALDWEIKRAGPSFAILTVQALLENTSNVALITGSEVFNSLPRWHKAQKLSHLVNFIVVTRATDTPEVERVLSSLQLNIEKSEKKRIYHHRDKWLELLDFKPLPYSATSLRESLKNSNHSEPPSGMPRSVWAFIKQNHLYAVS